MKTEDENINKDIKTSPSDDENVYHTGLDEMVFTNHSSSTTSEQKNASKKKLDPRKSQLSAPKKTMGPVCSCKLKCYENINQEARINIFKEYHRQTWRSQKQFIISRVTVKPVARHYGPRRHNPVREMTFNYTFLVDDKPVRVCKPFFLNTLGISSNAVRRPVKNAVNGVAQDDRRGKQPSANKTPEKIKDTVRTHIDLLNSQNLLLHVASELTIKKLYTLYLEFCEKESIPIINTAKYWLYRHILRTEYDSLFQPLEDILE